MLLPWRFCLNRFHCNEESICIIACISEYEKEANTDKDKLPDVVCVITGMSVIIIKI
jgi:hypothetical protein